MVSAIAVISKIVYYETVVGGVSTRTIKDLNSMMIKIRKSHQLQTLITGLPRSGTSLLTEIVACFGGNLGREEAYVTFQKSGRRGYNEHLELNAISNDLLSQCDRDFHFNLPTPEELTMLKNAKAKKKIKAIVNREKIDIYKDNKLVVLADLYLSIYPVAKWIFISRPIQETFRSRFGEAISFEDWQMISERREGLWYTTGAARLALYVEFGELKTNFDGLLERIAKYLDRPLSDEIRQKCRQCYLPR
jgi:hypothetical protein